MSFVSATFMLFVSALRPCIPAAGLYRLAASLYRLRAGMKNLGFVA